MKVGIITITIGENIGNKLQNYALQKVVKKYTNDCQTIKYGQEYKENLIKKILKKTLFYNKYKYQLRRTDNFNQFLNNIEYSDFEIYNDNIIIEKINKYDYFIAGSDQIWNLHYKENSKVFFLGFCDSSKKIAYAPSFGSAIIPDDVPENIKKWISEIKYLSVREEDGKNIVKKLTGRTDAEVLVDPTLLLDKDEWEKIAKKPKWYNNEKFILNYFLGDLSEQRRKEIERVAKENGCKIINILDKNDPYYGCGPAEFLYLEKNAFLICTDSFHSSVFGFIFNRPFIIFEREEKNIVSMNSRLNNLINIFELKNRKYDKEITEENLKHDYSKSYLLLKEEQIKSKKFLENALNIQNMGKENNG